MHFTNQDEIIPTAIQSEDHQNKLSIQSTNSTLKVNFNVNLIQLSSLGQQQYNTNKSNEQQPKVDSLTIVSDKNSGKFIQKFDQHPYGTTILQAQSDYQRGVNQQIKSRRKDCSSLYNLIQTFENQLDTLQKQLIFKDQNIEYLNCQLSKLTFELSISQSRCKDLQTKLLITEQKLLKLLLQKHTDHSSDLQYYEKKQYINTKQIFINELSHQQQQNKVDQHNEKFGHNQLMGKNINMKNILFKCKIFKKELLQTLNFFKSQIQVIKNIFNESKSKLDFQILNKTTNIDNLSQKRKRQKNKFMKNVQNEKKDYINRSKVNEYTGIQSNHQKEYSIRNDVEKCFRQEIHGVENIKYMTNNNFTDGNASKGTSSQRKIIRQFHLIKSNKKK